MTWLLGSIIASVGLTVGSLIGVLLMYGIIMRTFGKEGKRNLEDARRQHREYMESAATGHEIMRENGEQIKRLVDHAEEWFAIQGLCSIIEEPEDMILLPKELTDENGAKGLLVGGFFETIHMPCLTCTGGGQEECDECNRDATTHKVPLSWPTIKAIYAKIVENFGK